MRVFSDYTMHPKDDGTCFICGDDARCNGYIPARMIESEGPYYTVSLCSTHLAMVSTAKTDIPNIDSLIRRFGSAVKLANRIPGHEINEFCRLSATDMARGYVVHPSVTSDDCFYCNKPSNNRRDRSPTLAQLKVEANFEAPRYIVPCCKPCYEILASKGKFTVGLKARATLIAARSKHDINPCIGNSIWD